MQHEPRCASFQYVKDGELSLAQPLGLSPQTECYVGTPYIIRTAFEGRMSSSVPVQIQFSGPQQAPQLHTPHTGIYGTSPGSGRQEKQGSQAARKLLRRIQWDESLDEKEWTVSALFVCIYAQQLQMRSILLARGAHLQMLHCFRWLTTISAEGSSRPVQQTAPVPQA